jgi:ABC-type phosphate transport system permease subunit
LRENIFSIEEYGNKILDKITSRKTKNDKFFKLFLVICCVVSIVILMKLIFIYVKVLENFKNDLKSLYNLV